APQRGFLPQSGRLALWEAPSGAGIRVDHGLVSGAPVSPHYDPLLAKVMAHAATREAARRRLVAALEETVALGTQTTRASLIDPRTPRAFGRGRASTGFIPEPFAAVAPAPAPATLSALAAVLWFERSARALGHDPALAWSSSGALAWPLHVDWGAGRT